MKMADRPGKTPELHWFPFFVKDWLSSAWVQAMRPEQRGAYIQLLALAWGAGDSEPRVLLASASVLSGLGRRWAALSPLVLAQFEERDGWLYNQKLTDVWKEQQARRTRAVNRARKAGRASGQQRANNKFNSSSTQVNHSGMTMDLESSKDSLSRGAGAPAPSEARPATAPEISGKERRNGGGLQRIPDATGLLQMAGVRK